MLIIRETGAGCMGTLHTIFEVFCKSETILKNKIYFKKRKMEEEATQISHKFPFQIPSKLCQLACGFADQLCLSPTLPWTPSWCNHLFLLPLSHHLPQERNRDLFIFISPILTSAHVDESCPTCIQHMETLCYLVVYISTLCNSCFTSSDISMPKSDILVC